ncbi:NAD(P)-dependent oxidoreductase [Dietzia cinnamea]|uniref:precorrin-2 dehydrogenase n=1 Tax=Dietzia cinnamea TaxID=321318 RepID=A0A4R3ZU94_9ACTN|nr:NAD(P)-dependent oxidoreductase [Dietzia cinnamea]MCT1886950.1 SAM-dependent methyltransferase [Dietzia cinnamea]TCW23957.1 uroporphyrin-III C-methyltransferase/precorrin-2 dehydrogenase/sirohydrochlorin ferrochelatase [Dietzia cinnamea]
MTTAVSRAPVLDGLPLTVGLAGREVLLVGAGPVSARRATTFLEAGALVRVVAPRVDPAMADLAERAGDDLVVVTRPFTPADLDSPWMVHVATGDPRIDAEVAALCEQRRIWCVTAGDSALGSVRVPARTAVATPTGTVRIAVDSGDPRRSVRVGRHVARSLATAPAGLRARRRPATGWVALVGGSGDGDLLTVRARRLIHTADVLVVDGTADAALVAELDDDVEVLEAATDLPAARVADLVATRYAAGHGVVRIAASATLADRARELEAGGVDFEVVPGVV